MKKLTKKNIPIICFVWNGPWRRLSLCTFLKSVCTKNFLQQTMDRPLASYLISWQNQHFHLLLLSTKGCRSYGMSCINASVFTKLFKIWKIKKIISNFQDIASFENVRTPSIYKSSTQSQLTNILPIFSLLNSYSSNIFSKTFTSISFLPHDKTIKKNLNLHHHFTTKKTSFKIPIRNSKQWQIDEDK